MLISRSQPSEHASAGPRVVVIGSGLSGAAFSIAFTRSGTKFASLTLIERAERWGRGLAYSTEFESHLLNSRTETMGVSGDRQDFVYWLADRAVEDGPFARRRDYGNYLEERLTALIEGGAGAVRCIIRDEAVSLARTGNAVRVRLASGAAIEADVVVLATGNQKPATLPMFASLGDVVIRDPWDCDSIERVAPTEDVLLLGTGLTAVDVVLMLSKAARTGTIYALSRRGLTPRTHAPPGRVDAQRALPPVLSEALHELRALVRAAEAQGRTWREVVDALRASSPEMWRRMSLETKRRFLRHARPWWDCHRHKLAPSIASHIERLRESGALQILAGAPISVSARPDGAEVRYRPRGRSAPETLVVTRIVNCTGPNMEVLTTGDPLLTQILADGYGRPHETGLGLDVTEHGALIDARGKPSRHLFALGCLTQGAFWEVTAAPEIRARATALAQFLAGRAAIPPQ